MVTIITGATRSDSVLAAGHVIDMEAESAKLEEGTYLFETLTRKLQGGVVKTSRMEHKFRERRIMPCTAKVTAAAAAAATSVTVDQPTYFHRDEMVYCPSTDEVFLMNEDLGGGTTAGKITVVNKAGTGGITNAIAVDAVLVNLGESHAEGEAIPPATNVVEEEISTYLFQFDETDQITDIENGEANYGLPELAKRRKDLWISRKRKLNMVLYMGKQFRETTTASGPRRQGPKGLIEWLASNTLDAGGMVGGFTMKALGLAVRPTKAYSSSSVTKIGICGQKPWDSISAFPNAAIQINPGKDQNWGITLKELSTPFGDIMIGYDPMLSDEYGLADRMFILDSGKGRVAQLEHEKHPLVLKLNVQDSTDIHNIKDVVTGVRGLKLELPELHLHVYNCQ